MTDPQDATSREAPLLDLKAGANVLWSRKGLIASTALAFVVAAGAYAALTPPTFTASAAILVDPRQPRTTDTDNVMPGIGGDSAAIASQVAVIGSRELLGAVFDAEGLGALPEFNSGGMFGGTLSRAGAFETFLGGVDVQREGLTYVLDVNFSSRDPELASRVVNAIVARYIDGQVAQKADANAEVSDLLKGRIAGLQQDVLSAERAVEAFKAAHRIYDSGAGSTLVQTQIDQLNTQLQAAEEQARQASLKYEQAVAAGTSPQGLIGLTEILSSPSAEKLRDDYNARSTAYASAQSTYGAKHPTLVKLAAEVQRVEALMVREVERITAELKADRDVAQAVVGRIGDDIATLRSDVNQSSMDAVELRQLERNADASRQVLEQFQRRSEETGQYQNLQISDARVITNATAPLRPAWPKPSLLLSVAAFLGLAVGAGVALLLGPAEKRAPRPAMLKTVIERLRTPPTPRRRRQPKAAPVQVAVRPQALEPRVTPPAAVRAEAKVRPSPQIAAPAVSMVPPAPLRPLQDLAPRAASNTNGADVKAAIAELRRSRNYAELS